MIKAYTQKKEAIGVEIAYFEKKYDEVFASFAEKQKATQMLLQSAAHKLYSARAAVLEGDLKDAAEQKSVTEKWKENTDLVKKLSQAQGYRLAVVGKLSKLRAELNVSNLTESSKVGVERSAPPHAAPLKRLSLKQTDVLYKIVSAWELVC